jgi:FkbM family methyltransferase
MTSPFIMFDVGANNGSSSISFAQQNDNAIVYAFEPTPVLINTIKHATSEMKNYILTEAAVSDYNGRAMFNISGNGDWGCSSLLPLSDKANTEWGGRTDMLVTEQIEVDVIRLDKFIQENQIAHIDYLHIDTQGSDLNVLRGMGDCLSIVKEGVLEAAAKSEILYVGQNSMESSIEFLQKNEFEIVKIVPNDSAMNEVNIYFKNKNIT